MALTEGCAVTPNSTLETCCAAVNSTPLFTNGSYGCPFNYTGNLKLQWDECISNDNKSSTAVCASQPETSSAESSRISKLLAAMVITTLIGTLSYV
ncbi:hypothetical protein QCA50_007322 [Cerrena zonata]|uniref:Uncharacterized protein n=1 Tax=Cerrena zonata TaxID=2478898 RepID=A0AAW0GK98_9APHY